MTTPQTNQKHGALAVFGSGPGIGRNAAALFASRGFQKIFLLSRNSQRLKEDADFVQSARAGTYVETIPVDLADLGSVREALGKVGEEVELEAVLYNAARVGKSEILGFGAEDFEADLRISLVSLYAVAQWAIPKLLRSAEQDASTTPSFLVTSGLLYKNPAPAMFSLAACKGGQYNLVHSLHKEFEPKGVHCGLIVVGGRVADESEVTNAKNVAEETWKLFNQPKGKGDLDVVMLDPAYLEHVKKREQEDRK